MDIIPQKRSALRILCAYGVLLQWMLPDRFRRKYEKHAHQEITNVLMIWFIKVVHLCSKMHASTIYTVYAILIHAKKTMKEGNEFTEK